MNIITTNEELLAFCNEVQNADYITVDTEFLRENTYYPKLCVLQLAYHSEKIHSAVIDVLAKDLSLDPVLALFANEKIVKVFHSARQDLEIFYHDYGQLPVNFFDTQIAAMAAGYGEQVGYETLVRLIVNENIDKSNRFTDWSRRPLSQAQIEYARGDVTHLCRVYENLRDKLNEGARRDWVQDEFLALLAPELYEQDPKMVWEKIRTRSDSPQFLAYVRELAELRENLARKKNLPKTRIYKDDALLEMVASKPKSLSDLQKLRGLPQESRRGKTADEILKAFARVQSMEKADYPRRTKRIVPKDSAPESIVELLKVLLKSQSDRYNVASKLICTNSELEEFAANPSPDHSLMKGWRKEVFGDSALAVLKGDYALKANGKYVELVSL